MMDPINIKDIILKPIEIVYIYGSSQNCTLHLVTPKGKHNCWYILEKTKLYTFIYIYCYSPNWCIYKYILFHYGESCSYICQNWSDFFFLTVTGWTMYLSACFIAFYKYVSFKISLLLLVHILFNFYCVPKC